jgi:hypothetical protein
MKPKQATLFKVKRAKPSHKNYAILALNSKVFWGLYKGFTVQSLIEANPQYATWWIGKYKGQIHNSIVEAIRKQQFYNA